GADGPTGLYAEAALLITRATQEEKAKHHDEKMTLLSRAAALLSKARGQRKSWGRVLLLEGRVLEMQGHPEQALEKYQAAMERGEGGVALTQHVVWMLYERGRYADADTLLRKLPDET